MLGAIVASELVKDTKTVTVTVARQASLSFQGEVAEAEEQWVVLEGEEVSLSCSGVGGIPAPQILGYLGEEQLWEDSQGEGENVREGSERTGTMGTMAK